MSTKEQNMNDPNSCWNKAAPDEKMFILLGRDPIAPITILNWCNERVKAGLNKPEDEKIKNAMAIASKMAQEQLAKLPNTDSAEKRLATVRALNKYTDAVHNSLCEKANKKKFPYLFPYYAKSNPDFTAVEDSILKQMSVMRFSPFELTAEDIRKDKGQEEAKHLFKETVKNLSKEMESEILKVVPVPTTKNNADLNKIKKEIEDNVGLVAKYADKIVGFTPPIGHIDAASLNNNNFFRIEIGKFTFSFGMKQLAITAAVLKTAITGADISVRSPYSDVVRKVIGNWDNDIAILSACVKRLDSTTPSGENVPQEIAIEVYTEMDQKPLVFTYSTEIKSDTFIQVLAELIRRAWALQVLSRRLTAEKIQTNWQHYLKIFKYSGGFFFQSDNLLVYGVSKYLFIQPAWVKTIAQILGNAETKEYPPTLLNTDCYTIVSHFSDGVALYDANINDPKRPSNVTVAFEGSTITSHRGEGDLLQVLCYLLCNVMKSPNERKQP